MIETNTFAHLTHNLYHIIIKVLYFSTANDDAALYMPVMCYVIRSIYYHCYFLQDIRSKAKFLSRLVDSVSM